ncbi:MAG: hypothetical protein QOJ65_1382 [Fimbriimonadaceae bacterium]|nr:hypothetical protein [Fimbriimonadaceae bacterium]
MEFLSTYGLTCKSEIPSMGQSVDVVAIDSERVIAVEVKLHNWRRALEQCIPHKSVADYVVIVLAKKALPDELAHAARENGVGIVLFDHQAGSFRMPIRPKRSETIWQPQRKVFLSRFHEISNAVN